ncbi:hypothetical protein [Robertmurraya kyonggiensis]|uniref:Uncharacterized protein n=1 Tax=Robertmurraya kyonggiensis TaxID=1037680 RepID=A0A4U1D0C5_9BACI|nr:hypothetical protein [Robertmurraya kyonggiensis]TKC15662.1 hypothetical protein FA727_16170 [Robertmurraya kyonggiensis]
MDWISFLTGGTCVALAFALFTSSHDDEEDDIIIDEETESELVVNGHAERNVIMSCQTCRKLKKHREIKPNLFQCIKCKRHVDLRRAS